MKYVVSKLSFGQEFSFYAPNEGGGPAVKIGGILVKGGCNVRNEHSLVMTTDGVVTELSDEDAVRLAAHPVYQMYEKNGAMRLVGTRGDARSASGDLIEKDGSAQLTEKDFKKKGRKAPKAVAQAKAEEEEE